MQRIGSEHMYTSPPFHSLHTGLVHEPQGLHIRAKHEERRHKDSIAQVVWQQQQDADEAAIGGSSRGVDEMSAATFLETDVWLRPQVCIALDFNWVFE